MKHIIIGVFLLYSNFTFSQSITINKMENCIGEFSTNIEAICILNRFQFVLSDSLTNSKVYKYSENNIEEVTAGQKVIQFSSREEKTYYISYSTIDKNEYFNWLDFLKIKKYKKMKYQTIGTVKEEWYLNKNLGVQLISEQVKTTDNKMTIFKYTIKIADGNIK